MSKTEHTSQTPPYVTPKSHRNLFTLPWTVVPERTLFGSYWALLPVEHVDTVVNQPRPGAATIDTCGHQHQTETSLEACTNLPEMLALAREHAEGLADLTARGRISATLPADSTDMFRWLF